MSTPYVKRITLPSGQIVEIEISHQLQVCPSCQGDMGYPTDWLECYDHWHLQQRCPECFHEWESEHEHHVIDEYDMHLNDTILCIEEDLEFLAHANFIDFMDTFTKALEENAILPEDF